MSEAVEEPVEFVLNCFERNIGKVTAPGFLEDAVRQHAHALTLRTLLINNVADPAASAPRAQAAVDRGEIDRFFFVDELRSKGLHVSGLRESDFGLFLHWSDCCLAALVLEGPDLLCYCDVDLDLDPSGDWIGSVLQVMRHDHRVAVGNPAWAIRGGGSIEIESDEAGIVYFLGYGFTDQIFLLCRSVFARPIRRRWLPLWLDCPATLRWDGAAEGLFFEQIIDAFMRRNRLLRVTITSFRWVSDPHEQLPRDVVDRSCSQETPLLRLRGDARAASSMAEQAHGPPLSSLVSPRSRIQCSARSLSHLSSGTDACALRNAVASASTVTEAQVTSEAPRRIKKCA